MTDPNAVIDRALRSSGKRRQQGESSNAAKKDKRASQEFKLNAKWGTGEINDRFLRDGKFGTNDDAFAKQVRAANKGITKKPSTESERRESLLQATREHGPFFTSGQFPDRASRDER